VEIDTGRLAGLLSSRRLSLAVAESCTGGLISGAITDRPGSSEYFLGGVVAYSNKIKHSMLGVPEILLEKYGAVSRQVACAMAEGARSRFNADFAVSATGIAGPSGGTPEKPVGLVYIGIAVPGNIISREFLFKGERKEIRENACREAIRLLTEQITLWIDAGG